MLVVAALNYFLFGAVLALIGSLADTEKKTTPASLLLVILIWPLAMYIAIKMFKDGKTK